MGTEVVDKLVGTIDGVNTTFSTPSYFVDGTFRYVLNGITYHSDHPAFGFVATAPDQVTLNAAPLAGDEVSGHWSQPSADGSPFHPTGELP